MQTENLQIGPDSAKGKLLSCAAILFRKQGFEKTTVRDIAQILGVKSGSLFHHFRTKEEILKEVMRQSILVNFHRQSEQISYVFDPVERLRTLIHCELESIHGETGNGMAVLVSEWRSLTPDSQQELLELRDQYESVWLEALDTLKVQGFVGADSNTFVLRRLLSGAINWTVYWFRMGEPLEVKELVDYCMNMMLLGEQQDLSPAADILSLRDESPAKFDSSAIT